MNKLDKKKDVTARHFILNLKNGLEISSYFGSADKVLPRVRERADPGAELQRARVAHGTATRSYSN